MKKCLICFMFFTLPFVFSGQINSEVKCANHWYFGDKAGLNFSSGAPVLDTSSQMYMRETGSTISDDNGNLLFYTNGDTIWNKNHLIMANGVGLMNCFSATQGGLIVKKPSSNTLYYIFTNDCAENNGVNGVHYSIVDMSLNAGLGAVTVKNVLLYAPSTEKFTATYHCNGTDVWLLGQYRNSNTFCAYLLSDSGISNTPILSNLGYIHKDDSTHIAGSMKFSPNSEKLIAIYTEYPNGVENLFDFNNVTGDITNFINLPSDTSEYGASFSDNNSKLYIQSGVAISRIIQYDVTTSNSLTIIASRNVVFQERLYSSLLGLQLNLGKIYGSIYATDTLLIINNPNSYGNSCNIAASGIYLKGRQCEENLPHYNENYFSTTLNTTLCSTGLANNDIPSFEISIYPNPAIDFIEIDPGSMQISKIKIYNQQGGLILNKTIELLGERKINFNTKQLNQGMYFIEIETNKGKKNKKIIINKTL